MANRSGFRVLQFRGNDYCQLENYARLRYNGSQFCRVLCLLFAFPSISTSRLCGLSDRSLLQRCQMQCLCTQLHSLFCPCNELEPCHSLRWAFRSQCFDIPSLLKISTLNRLRASFRFSRVEQKQMGPRNNPNRTPSMDRIFLFSSNFLQAKLFQKFKPSLHLGFNTAV
jgi:hypothetical protein